MGEKRRSYVVRRLTGFDEGLHWQPKVIREVVGADFGSLQPLTS